ncbi:Gfo/Idh/MocA family protein [Intestinibacillus massiliensis]|uniref:Gfo/Idh/MocA family protein n=1 Tax=Intestinibacillus massiliensis TaxID=1871029 RepID=UPI000B35E97B|nr:Gfo/Idh/MocA family oxidoreductase [Intestinibacillus massiliensis]
MAKVRVGVIGIGDISDVYLNNLKKYDVVEVVACASRGLEKAQRKAAQHGIPKAYASGAELIADPDIDLVLNLTTPQAHFEYNLAALQAGKHVYTEKPLATTYAEGRQLVELAREKGLYIGCAPDTFLGGRLQNIREMLDSGKIGRVTGGGAYFVSHGHEFHHPAPAFFYQPGAGPLYDMGPYYMTALLSLLGPVSSVCAMATKAGDTRVVPSGPCEGQVLPVDVDTHIVATLGFACGAVVSLTCSFDVWDSELPRLELYGSEGTILVDEKDPISGPNLFGGDTLVRAAKQYRWQDPARSPQYVDVPWTVAPNAHPFNSVSHEENPRGIGLVDMVYAIRDGRTARASGDMALHSLEVMECILRSAHGKVFCTPETTFERPAPLPVDFPASEG